MDAGILRRADPEDISVTLWTHAHGLVTLYLRGVLQIDEPSFEEVYVNSSRRVLAGLATPEFAASLLEKDQAMHLSRPETRTETGQVRYKTGT
jgi:hypothetical protein